MFAHGALHLTHIIGTFAPMIIKRTQLGATLRRLRKARGLNLADVAYAAGTDPANISRVERGIQGHSDELLAALARALGVQLSELFREAEAQAGLEIREEGAGYSVLQDKSLRQLTRRYAQAPPKARELVDTLVSLSASGKLPDEVCRSLLSLLSAISGVKTKKPAPKRRKTRSVEKA